MFGLIGLMSAFSVVSLFVAVHYFRSIALEVQRESLSRVVSVAANEKLRQLDGQLFSLGTSLKEREEFQQVLATYLNTGDSERLRLVLQAPFDVGYATMRTTDLVAMRFFDPQMRLVAAGKYENKDPGEQLPSELRVMANSRQGSDRLKAISLLWRSDSGPRYSILLPVGGLRLVGYLEVAADPNFNLRAIEQMTSMPIALESPGGKRTYASESFASKQSSEMLRLQYVLRDRNGLEVLQVLALNDVSKLYESEQAMRIVTLIATAIMISLGIFVGSATVGVLQSTIDNLRKELQGHSENLEDKVKKRTAELAVARDEAEAASHAKSAFLANMSHEIRTPMNAIIGFTHMLRRNNPRPDQSERLGQIEGAAEHLLSIINDILDMSKIEAGKMQIEKSDFDPEFVILNICNILQERIGSKAIALIVDLHALPETLYGDGQRLGQVLLNLMGNAVKFTNEGSITVRAWVVAVSDVDLTIRFEVIDTGIGLTAEQLGRLFKPFEQADASTSRKYGGTGLGLAISQRMIELMGGRIGVESELEHGSTFWVEVPFGFGEKVLREHAKTIETVGLRVLLAETQPEARAALCGMLDMLGIEVTLADSGSEALCKVQDADVAGSSFDLLLVDSNLPDIDGLSLGNQLSELPLTRQPVRLLMTAYGKEPSAEQLGNAGYFDMLLKPVAPSALNELIQGALSGKHQPSGELLPGAAENNLQRRGGAKVLLVEDNLINQEVACDLLRNVGIHADIAENGEIAVSKVREKAYELILMDMHMPVLDGLEATRQIRELPDRQSVPILAMTANAYSDSREACLAAGMNDHVAKPVTSEAFYAALLRWLPEKPEPETVYPQISSPLQAVSSPSARVPQLADFTIAGIDTSAGLRCVGGKLAFYRRLLLQFAENGNAAQLLRAAQDGDIEAAHLAAHTLKGLAGTIGALALKENAAAIDSKIRGYGPIDPEFDLFNAAIALDAEFRKLAEEIQTVLGEHTDHSR